MSGNVIRGQTPFTVGASAYVMLFDINALASIQESLGIKVAQLEQTLAGGDVVAMREIFRIGLLRHHPSTTAADAGDIMHEMGVEAAAGVLERAFTASFPQEPGSPPKAPKSKGGTSSAS